MSAKKRSIAVLSIVFSLIVWGISLTAYAGYSEGSRWQGNDFNSKKDLSGVTFEDKDTLNNKKFGYAAEEFSSKEVGQSGVFHESWALPTKKFAQQIRVNNKKFLMKKMNDRGGLSKGEAKYLVECFDKYHAGRAVLTEGEDSKSVAAFLKVAHDNSKDLREKQYAIKRYFEENE